MKLPKTKSKTVTDIHGYSFLIYGQPKAGKSTFCSHFDNAIFIATEPGHKFLEVYKVDPVKWSQVEEVFKGLYMQRDEKQFKTIIIDTVDNLFSMAEKAVEQEHGVKYVHDLEFGKGSNFTKKKVIDWVNLLGQVGYGMVFVSHEKFIEVEEGGLKYSRKDITLSGAARKAISSFCDFIFYFYADRDDKRLIKTKGHKELNAGDRSGILPEVLPMDFHVLEKELKKFDHNKNQKQSNKGV